MDRRLCRIFLAVFIVLSMFSFSPVVAIDTPQNLTATSLSDGDIGLEWDTVSGADYYDIYWDTTNTFPGGAADAQVIHPTNTYTASGLTDGTEYYFWVVATNGETSTESDSDSAISDASPPTYVTLSSPSDSSYVLVNPPTFQWDPVTDDTSGGKEATGLDYYELNYSSSPVFNPSSTVSVSNITGTSYTPGTTLLNGTYYWRVRAFDNAGNVFPWTDGGINVFSFTLNIQAPTPSAPANGSYLNNDPPGEVPPTFQWSVVSGADGYLLEVDTVSPISGSPAYSYTIPGESTTSYDPLNTFSDGTYYWRVSATDGGSTTGYYSSEWSFTVDTVEPDAPTLSAPADGATVYTDNPQLSWNDGMGYTYDLEVSDSNTVNVDGSFTSTIINPSNLTNSSYSPTLADDDYYWHVRSQDQAENYSDWSSMWSFTVDTTVSPPELTSPADEAEIGDSTPTLNWDPVTGASTYTLEYSTSNTFPSTGTVTVEDISVTQYTIPAGESLDNDTYYWRVSSDLAPTVWSEVWEFTVDAEPVEQPVSFTVIVRAGATGNALNDARAYITSGPTTVDSDTTGSNGQASLSATPGTYTLRVTKNLWDSGDGTDYQETIVVQSSSDVFTVYLYQSGRDLLVASVRYNDKNSTTPPSILIFRDGQVYSTVSMPELPPSSMMPSNLTTARTNLVIEVPSTGVYTIADPGYTEGAVGITNLSAKLATAYVNSVTLQVTSSVNGVVVDEAGNLLSGASVMLLRKTDSAIIGAVETTKIGFLFNLIIPDQYYLRVSKSGYDTVSSDPFIVGPHETKNVGMITLTQPKGTLNITVQDGQGELITNANVKVVDGEGTIVFSQLASQGIVGTELPEGTYTISATATGYTLVQEISATVTVDETISKIVVMEVETTPPAQKGSMQLTVNDASGNPIQLVNVYMGTDKVGVTNQDGILLIEELEPQSYQMTLKKEGYQDLTFSVNVTAGDTATYTGSMDAVVVTEESSSRMIYIIATVGGVGLFALILILATRRKGPGTIPTGGRAGPPPPIEPMRPVVSEKKAMPRFGPSPRASRGGGLPPSSAREETRGGMEKERGGIPTHSLK